MLPRAMFDFLGGGLIACKVARAVHVGKSQGCGHRVGYNYTLPGFPKVGLF